MASESRFHLVSTLSTSWQYEGSMSCRGAAVTSASHLLLLPVIHAYAKGILASDSALNMAALLSSPCRSFRPL
jgi:hypothetical protein